MTIQADIYDELDCNSSPETVVLRIRGGVVTHGDELAPEPLTDERGRFPGLYKGGSDQMFVTYELGSELSEDGSCPQVTRVYLSGDLCGWEIGTFKTRSGADVYGVKIEYQQTHETYRARDIEREYESAAHSRRYTKIIEIPVGATTIDLRAELPDRYRHALHRL